MSDRKPVVHKAAWSFDLVGPCCWCGKTVRGIRTFYAKSFEDATTQADAAMPGLCHRKCGAY